MTAEKNKPRLLELEPGIVLLFMAISVPVIILGAMLILGFVRVEMNRAVGEDFLGGAAQDTARQLDSYLVKTLDNVLVISVSPILHEVVMESNRRYSEEPETIRDRLVEIDKLWRATNGAMQMALDTVRNPASDFLRRAAEIHEPYAEILVTDRQGALVAATNITSDYYQADEAWWQQTFGDGDTGAPYSGGVSFDASADTYALEVAVPILLRHEDGSTEVVGVMKALIDAGELFSVVGSVRRGDTGHALLLDSRSGEIIIGSNTAVMATQFENMTLLKEAIADERRFFVGQQGDGEKWINSFASLPQPDAAYENWLVVVRQRFDETHEPISAATLYVISFAFVIGAMIILFSLYMHYKLVKPIREIDLREEMDRLAANES